jgi:Family of unknown function (DUF5309)
MAAQGYNSTAVIGNGTTGYQTDIVVKDLDLDVSNRVKDDTPVLNMCMAKKRKVVSTLPLWTNDVYRLPQIQANQEGQAVSSSNVESQSRANLGNYTQIFSTVVGATGTARAVEQSGGDPQAYQEVKQLIELMFDVEAQIVRNDQIGTKYSGQSGLASGFAGNVFGNVTNISTGTITGNAGVAGFTFVSNVTGNQGGNVQYQTSSAYAAVSSTPPVSPVSGSVTTFGPQTGRRMGSLNSFAGTHSFNPSTASPFYTVYNSESSDTTTVGTANVLVIGGQAGTNNGEGLGSNFYSYTSSLQQFAPSLYKQLVTTAEQRFNAKIRTIVCPTSLRTHLSDTMPTSRGINRVNSERGDTIATYEGDFNYTYEIFDSWIMDQVGVGNSIYFLNEEVLQWGSLRDLGPNNEVFSNADASLDQFILEGTLIVRNPAGVAVLHDISPLGTYVGASPSSGQSGSLRSTTYVGRLNAWDATSF